MSGPGKQSSLVWPLPSLLKMVHRARLLAPTSILASQHSKRSPALFTSDENAVFPFRPEEIRLLIGDTPDAEKAEIRKLYLPKEESNF